MQRPNKYQAYQAGAVLTASPAQLVLMLYDGALKFLNIALEAFKIEDPLEFNQKINQNVQKAQAIIRELRSCLDTNHNPEFAQRMTSLYDYFDRRLQDGNLKKRPEPIEEVLKHLIVIRDAWKEMTVKQPTANSPQESTVGEWSATV